MTREEAIDILKRNYPSSCFEDLCEAVEIAIQTLSAQPERKWIPVTERLPKEGQRVLVTYDLVNDYPWVNIMRYGKAMFEDKVGFYVSDSEWGDVSFDGIVAWMPLPEPYKEAENGNN